MRELFDAIPDVDVLVGLEPEELGAKLIFLLRNHHDMFVLDVLLNSFSSGLKVGLAIQANEDAMYRLH